MEYWTNIIGFCVLGYLTGSLNLAIWLIRWLKGVDVRASGSGHATTTNTFRQAGLGAGLAVFVFDVSKGLIPTYLALQYGVNGWLVIPVAALVVAGHCWPVFAEFRGGMGLAPAGGSLLAISPLGFAIGLGMLIVLALTIHHAARASVIAALLNPVALFILKFPFEIIGLATAVGLVLAIRFLADWRREYRELWLDRG